MKTFALDSCTKHAKTGLGTSSRSQCNMYCRNRRSVYWLPSVYCCGRTASHCRSPGWPGYPARRRSHRSRFLFGLFGFAYHHEPGKCGSELAAGDNNLRKAPGSLALSSFSRVPISSSREVFRCMGWRDFHVMFYMLKVNASYAFQVAGALRQ